MGKKRPWLFTVKGATTIALIGIAMTVACAVVSVLIPAKTGVSKKEFDAFREELRQFASGLVEYKNGLPEADSAVVGPYLHGQVLMRHREWESAIGHFSRARASATGRHLVALNNYVGMCNYRLREFRYARADFQSALDSATVLLDREGEAAAEHNLGVTFMALARLAEAESLHRRYLATVGAARGEDSPHFALGLVSLGLVYDDLGRSRDAESLYKSAFTALAREQRPGGPDPVAVLLRVASPGHHYAVASVVHRDTVRVFWLFDVETRLFWFIVLLVSVLIGLYLLVNLLVSRRERLFWGRGNDSLDLLMARLPPWVLALPEQALVEACADGDWWKVRELIDRAEWDYKRSADYLMKASAVMHTKRPGRGAFGRLFGRGYEHLAEGNLGLAVESLAGATLHAARGATVQERVTLWVLLRFCLKQLGPQRFVTASRKAGLRPDEAQRLANMLTESVVPSDGRSSP